MTKHDAYKAIAQDTLITSMSNDGFVISLVCETNGHHYQILISNCELVVMAYGHANVYQLAFIDLIFLVGGRLHIMQDAK